MTSMIVGIFVVGIVLLRLVLGGDLLRGGVVKTHERIVSIEQTMIDSYNLSDTPKMRPNLLQLQWQNLKKSKQKI